MSSDTQTALSLIHSALSKLADTQRLQTRLLEALLADKKLSLATKEQCQYETVNSHLQEEGQALYDDQAEDQAQQTQEAEVQQTFFFVKELDHPSP